MARSASRSFAVAIVQTLKTETAQCRPLLLNQIQLSLPITIRQLAGADVEPERIMADYASLGRGQQLCGQLRVHAYGREVRLDHERHLLLVEAQPVGQVAQALLYSLGGGDDHAVQSGMLIVLARLPGLA